MKRPSGTRIAALAGLLAVAGAIAWLVTTRGPLAPAAVTVEPARGGPLAVTTFGIGTVEARRAYSIGPTTASRVLRVLVDQGDTVRAGQLLAELDPVDLDERLASGRLAAERSASAVLAAQAQHAEATSRAELAAASARRVAELRSKGFFSQDAADAKAHEATAAQASSRAAQALLDAARRDQERAHTDLAALGRLRAQARLTSPADGVVTARLVEPGSTVVAGQAVLQLADPASVWVRARIDQGQAGGVRVGQPVRIVLRSDPARPLAGEVRRIDQVSDAVAEERIVNVAFTARPPALPLGELVEVTIDLARLPDALSVPTAALARLDRREGVWLVRDGRAQFRALSTGVASQDGRTQVLSGIASGDEVVVHSERVLRPGARVKVVDAIHRGEP